MDEEGKTYSEMIQEYKEMGATNGYADAIKNNIKHGVLYGERLSAMSIQDVLNFEQDRVNDAGAANQKLLDYIDENRGEGTDTDFKKMIKGYEKLSNETTMGAVRSFLDQHFIEQASAYEESKNGVMLTPQQMLQFEIDDKENIGKVHLERLKMLYGRETISDDDIVKNKLEPPSDEAEKEKRKKAYLEEAKSYKQGRDVKLAVEAEVNRICSSDKLLYQELKEHENNRKEYYANEFTDLVGVHKSIQNRITMLEEQIKTSQSVVNNIDMIKEKPEIIFSKLKEFEEAVKLRKMNEEKEAAMQNEQQRLIAEAQKAEEKVEKQKEGEQIK